MGNGFDPAKRLMLEGLLCKELNGERYVFLAYRVVLTELLGAIYTSNDCTFVIVFIFVTNVPSKR